MRRLLSAACVALLALAGCGSKDEAAPPADGPTCAIGVGEPVLPDEMVQDLGTLQVGTEASFVVPAGTESFVLLMQEAENSAPDSVTGVDATSGPYRVPNAVVPSVLRAPDGTVFYDDLVEWPSTTIGTVDDYPDVERLLAYEFGFRPILGALPVPNTSGALDRLAADGGVLPGTWTFTVSDWALTCPFPGCNGGNGGGRYRVHVVTRPAQSTAPTLDVEVYLATDPTSALPTASAARTDAHVARWEGALASYLAGAGIALGEVRYNDLPPAVRSRYAPNGEVSLATSGPCSDLNQLFASAQVRRRAIHLFFADALVAPGLPDGTGIAGVDGSIPGPSGFPGTIYGGAIVGIENLPFGDCTGAGPDLSRCGADFVAYVTAHEIGHWLGLYHTTESDGFFFDPVSDTDRCPCLSCAAPEQQAQCTEVQGSAGTTVVRNDRCVAGGTCGGGRNLMFWLVDDRFSTGELSDDQRRIVQLNPAVR